MDRVLVWSLAKFHVLEHRHVVGTLTCLDFGEESLRQAGDLGMSAGPVRPSSVRSLFCHPIVTARKSFDSLGRHLDW